MKKSNMWSCVLCIVLVLIGMLSTGCAFTPKPVVLAEKPTSLTPLPGNNLKIAVVVRDGRPETVQKAKLCGTMRNSYMMPTNVAFLAHKESLDVITAKHICNILERSGYTVVGAYPAVPENLSKEQIKDVPVANKELKEARKVNASDVKPQKTENKEGIVLVEDYKVNDSLASWVKADWKTKPDAILDVKIDKFNSDSYQGFVTVLTQGWCDYKLAICDPDENKRTVVWGKGFKGIGTSGPRAVITEDCYIISVNMAYWNMMGKIEETVRTDEFKNLVIKASEL